MLPQLSEYIDFVKFEKKKTFLISFKEFHLPVSGGNLDIGDDRCEYTDSSSFDIPFRGRYFRQIYVSFVFYF